MMLASAFSRRHENEQVSDVKKNVDKSKIKVKLYTALSIVFCAFIGSKLQKKPDFGSSRSGW